MGKLEMCVYLAMSNPFLKQAARARLAAAGLEARPVTGRFVPQRPLMQQGPNAAALIAEWPAEQGRGDSPLLPAGSHTLPLVIVVPHATPFLNRQLLAAGAQAVVPRGDLSHLPAATRAALAGGYYLPARLGKSYSGRKPTGLTPRAREVLAAFARGPTPTRAAVATALGLSRHGVDWHLQRIYRALGARSLAGALFCALELGLIPAEK